MDHNYNHKYSGRARQSREEENRQNSVDTIPAGPGRGAMEPCVVECPDGRISLKLQSLVLEVG